MFRKAVNDSVVDCKGAAAGKVHQVQEAAAISPSQPGFAASRIGPGRSGEGRVWVWVIQEHSL